MDKELVLKAKKHDKDAFTALIQQYKLSMYKAAKAILKNEEDIADAMQDTILDCWEKIHTLRKPEFFKTWLMRILINNCNAIYNQKSRVVLDNEIILEGTAESDYENVEWQDMMNCLNEKQRIVVELYYVEQFKVREIAEILQIGQSAVKGRLQSARKSLEAYYSGCKYEKKVICSRKGK